MTDYVKLGGMLKDAREAADYTQKFAADLLHLTPANISSWERGKSRIDIESYIRLCHLYGINAVEPLAASSDNFTYPHFPVEVPGLPLSDGSEFEYEQKKSPSISEEDQQLLSSFHKLDEKDQYKVLGYIDSLYGTEKYSAKDASKRA